MTLNTSETIAQTRLLLALWDMTTSGETAIVKKSELLNRVKKKNEKSLDFQPLLEELAEKGSIALTKEKRTIMVSLADSGVQLLGEGLRNPEFEYTSAIGKKDANALLNWIRQMGGLGSGSMGAGAVKTIDSYEAFKDVALDVYDRLNRDYNLDDLVPIYRIRREIGDRISPSQFDDWLLELQANDVLQLQGGSLPDSDASKIEDSITTELSGLRCYAKLL
ncbi:MAG: hypothetical protein WA882_09575 [Geitlerinemataceae cyanobacterium]